MIFVLTKQTNINRGEIEEVKDHRVIAHVLCV